MIKVGQKVLHYKILEKLGVGGMGVVYKAEDTVLKRTVALKFFQPELMASEETRSRLVREARAASNLDHPSICTIHQIEEAEDGRLFICMGFCDGDSLRDRLGGEALAVEDKLAITIQIAEGLAHAHERGIVHRDIKPENVIIGPDGRARIMDFGLAKLIGKTTILKSGTVAGTLPYMSPEQVKGSEVDHRSDVWSVGAMLYELLTGKTPFAGDYEAAVLYSIANEPAEHPSDICVDVPADLENIVLRALEKDPEDRYQSMQEMLTDLVDVRSGMVGGEQPSTRRIGRRTSRKVFRRRIMIAALVSTVIVAFSLILLNIFGVEATPVSVVVLDFENNTEEEEFDKIPAKLLLMDFEESPNVEILKRERMLALRKKHDIQSNDVPSGIRLARLAGYRTVVSGEVLKVGKALRVNAKVYDVDTEDLLFTEYAQGEGIESIFDMMDDLSRDIRTGMKAVPRWKRDEGPALAELTTESVEAYRLFTQGQTLRDSDPNQAKEFLEQAIALDPAFFDAHIEAMLLYSHQLGDDSNALISARRAKELSKDRGPKEYLKSLIYESWSLKKWDSVIEEIRRYLDLEPDDMRIQRRLGWCLARRPETYDAAIHQLKKVIELDPDNLSGEIGSAYNHLGYVYMFKGEHEEALAVLEEYRSISPNSSAPLNSIGDVYRLSGRYKEAERQYLEVLGDDPDYYLCHEGLGQTYLSMGRWREALSTFRRLLTVCPPDLQADAHMYIAEVYCTQEDFVLAGKELDEALRLDPGSLWARSLRGVVALEADDADNRARAELDSLGGKLGSACAPSDRAYYDHLLGRIRLAEGRNADGLKALKGAIESCRREECRYFTKELVKGYLEGGRSEEAIREGLALLKCNPDDGGVLTLLGLAYEQKGDNEEMARHLERASTVWAEADRDFLPLRTVQEKL